MLRDRLARLVFAAAFASDEDVEVADGFPSRGEAIRRA